MGRAVSTGRGGREMAEPVGESMNSRPTSGAIEDRRLRAMLGEYTLPYTLPPQTLVLREKTPDPSTERGPLPRVRCWFGRMARGMKMNDLSLAGKM